MTPRPDYPIKVTELDLNTPLQDICELEDFASVQVMIRLHGVPVGYIKPPIVNGRVEAAVLADHIMEQHSMTVLQHLLRNGLNILEPGQVGIDSLFTSLPRPGENFPLVTVAVCTRDRTEDLALCLEALCRLDYPLLDLLVVDNAPSNLRTETLIRTHFPQVRYVLEPRPGLDWARNRAAVEARGEVIAYTDDDVLVDPLWIRAVAQAFEDFPDAGGVTGMVAPFEMGHPSQVLFELYGGFGRGFQRREYRVQRGAAIPWRLLGAGQFGTGANMSYRRSFLEQAGLFDPALDVGTVTNGGGDLEMFHRVLKNGWTLVYDPEVMVFHRHRRDMQKLRTQLANNGVGLYSYFRRTAFMHKEDIPGLIRLGVWWIFYWNLGRLWRSLFTAWRFPRDLILAELKGCFTGLRRYLPARQTAAEIVKKYGPGPELPKTKCLTPPPQKVSNPRSRSAVRTVDLSRPVEGLYELEKYASVRVFLMWRNRTLGHVVLHTSAGGVSRRRLVEAAVNHLGLRLFDPEWTLNDAFLWAECVGSLRRHLVRHLSTDRFPRSKPTLSLDVRVSVVVGTFDRPEDLRRCLESLVAQKTDRDVEILVVDNHPASGLTRPVVREFPQAVLIEETRRGISYGRNAGILAAQGDIVVTTDDDVTMPPDWLENLVAPFARTGVMAVTGNILPVALETRSQHIFESYGGLGRGTRAREFSGQWFDSFRWSAVPTWELGGTANAAFRAAVFRHPEIGLMKEELGPGMPSGVGEDTYLFYKILKAGYTHCYEPAAQVWHRHRPDMNALRRQIYNYSKGHVAYHLTTALCDGDRRALLQLAWYLPKAHLQRIRGRLARRTNYPLRLNLLEIRGNLAGPWALWKSIRMVRREGRSAVPSGDGGGEFHGKSFKGAQPDPR